MLSDDINRFLGTFSYPFTSLDGLFEDVLQTYYDILEPTVADKTQIRADMVKYINEHYNIYSYDEIYLYLEKWYLYPQYEDFEKNIQRHTFDEIWRHLVAFTKCFISQRDGKIVYKYWENEGDTELLGGFKDENKIYLFHSLNHLMPLDILVIIYMVENGKRQHELNNYNGNIVVSDALLDKVLEQGIAENHLHSGASVSFLTTWDDLMKPISESTIKKMGNIKLNCEYSNKEIKVYLLIAGLLRTFLLLATKTLLDNENYDKDEICEKTKELYNFPIPLGNKVEFGKFITYYSNEDSSCMNCYFLEQWECMENSFALKSLKLRDILEVNDHLYTSDENLFLFHIISFIDNYGKDKKGFVDRIKILFLNYLRIKNFFYQQMVQQKTIHGLDFFHQQYYVNNSQLVKAGRNIAGQEKWERAIREQLQDSNLRKIELRSSIDNRERLFANEIYSFLISYRKILRESYCSCTVKNGETIFTPILSFPKIGLVFHLVKEEQNYYPEKCAMRGIEDNTFLQYGKLYYSYKSQIEIFTKVRNNPNKQHLLGKYIVGIDVCNLENAVPTWVFVPIFEHLRDSKIEPLNDSVNMQEDFQSLNFTFHAGEDFRHLLSGLRRIYEIIKYLKFHAGDRIGHGIALGISASTWYNENPTVIIPRIEALENYLWAYDLFSNHCTGTIMVNLSYLEKRIHTLSSEIYGSNMQPTITALLNAYKLLFTKNYIEKMQHYTCKNCKLRCNFQNTEHSSDEHFAWTSENLLFSKACRFFVKKMNEPIHLKITPQDVEITTLAKELTKNYINQQGIIIEINPSSNVAISNISTVKESQVYDVNNYGYSFENLIACINSDDPAVFNTNACNELGYIYFGMLQRGSGREAALQWINKLRQNGMDASFIRHSNSDLQTLKELDYLVENM